MERNVILCLLLTGLGPLANAQLPPPTAEQDSLRHVWDDVTRPDTLRMEACYAYINSRFEGVPDSAEHFADRLYAFAESKGSRKFMAKALNQKGAAAWGRGEFDQALVAYEQGMRIAEEIGDLQMASNIMSNMANIHRDRGRLTEALDLFLRSMRIKERIKDSLNLGRVNNNIALIYLQQRENTRALEYLNAAKRIYEAVGYRRGLVTLWLNMGAAYADPKDLPRKLEAYENSLAMAKELGDMHGIASAMGNLGSLYSAMGDHALAEATLKEAIGIFSKLGERQGLVTCYNKLGLVLLDQGKYREGVDRCEESLALARALGTLDGQKQACQCLHSGYRAMGRYEKALEYHELLSSLKDTLFNADMTSELTRLRMQNDYDKKDAAMKAEQERKDALAAQELRRQKVVRNGFMGGFALVALFAGVFLVQRNRISRARKRSDELLLNILPEEVAEELKAKGSAEAVHIDQVTVLFTDFKGFTAMSETLSPQELVRDLNDCFSAFDHITEKYGIEKIKTIGDAYMAAGGLPVANTTHAMDVIKAAFEMRDFVEAGKARKIAAGLPYFEIRIGIHTGPVVAGIVGVKKFQYDIWGDTVNTASRMESSGDVGQVNISEATYDLVKNDPGLTFTPRGKVQAKGKGEMEMYFVETSR